MALAVVSAGVAGLIAGAEAAPRARFPEYQELYERHLPFMLPGAIAPAAAGPPGER